MPRDLPGPVTNVPRSVSLKKRQRKANKGSFTKERPGPGRPRGVPNKFTGELKEAILAGVNGSNPLGVAGFVCDLSQDTPTSAAALLGRLIPGSMAGAGRLEPYRSSQSTRRPDESEPAPPQEKA